MPIDASGIEDLKVLGGKGLIRRLWPTEPPCAEGFTPPFGVKCQKHVTLNVT
jgi:hypothetical protein